MRDRIISPVVTNGLEALRTEKSVLKKYITFNRLAAYIIQIMTGDIPIWQVRLVFCAKQ